MAAGARGERVQHGGRACPACAPGMVRQQHAARLLHRAAAQPPGAVADRAGWARGRRQSAWPWWITAARSWWLTSNRFGTPGASASLAVVRVADALADRPALARCPAGVFPREMTVAPSGRTLLVTLFRLRAAGAGEPDRPALTGSPPGGTGSARPSGTGYDAPRGDHDRRGGGAGRGGQGRRRRAAQRAAGEPSFLLVLTHGSGGRVATPDVLAVQDAGLRLGGVTALVTQPYRVKGRRAPGPAERQDAAWAEVIRALREISGLACR